MNKGKVVQVIGPVIDVEFDPDKVPDIYTALVIKDEEGVLERETIICEVQQQLGRNMVRAVAMTGTDGVKRGMEVTDTGQPISVPVGNECLGRLFNILGETIDGKEQVKTEKRSPIHRRFSRPGSRLSTCWSPT